MSSNSARRTDIVCRVLPLNLRTFFFLLSLMVFALAIGPDCFAQPTSTETDPAASQEKKQSPNSDRSDENSSEQDPPATDPPKTPVKRPASEIRRPTAPTDAEGLEVRPPKPKFVNSKERKVTDVLDLTFDDLAFDINEGEPFRWSMLTPEIQAYDGAKIRLRGFIRPSFSARKLKQFVFVRDNQECCFGPGAALFDCVLVKMAEGKETDYTVRPVTIEGEFYMRKYAGPDGNVWAIFRLKDGQVK